MDTPIPQEPQSFPPVSPELNLPVSPVPELRPRQKIWSWFAGLLVPIAAIIIRGVIPSTFGATYKDSFFAFYVNELINFLLAVAISPIILAGLLHIPGVATEVAGFGVPSPSGLLLSAVFWVLAGRGMYALYHSRLRVLFWLILAALLLTVFIGGYVKTNDYRALDSARRRGSTEACANLEGEMKGYCIIEAAVSANDPSMCEQIPGWQRSSCYNQLGATYSPLPGMK